MNDLQQAFYDFIENPLFPCIGAKAALKKKCLEIYIAQNLNSTEDDIDILAGLYCFIELWKKRNNVLQTFVVIFDQPLESSEQEFETSLWGRLQRLHDLDKEIYHWDPQVSSELGSPEFCFSIGGQGFFVIGLHPHSSRKARQFLRPALVFNLHAQFERLKKKGTFDRMKNKIREREAVYSGSINPMVHDFGENSEALQYSGMQVCPQHSLPFTMQHRPQQPWTVIKPCSGTSFILKKGELLVVQDIEGEQVADLFCFSMDDKTEFLSSGKTIDYNGKILLTSGDQLYSNKSNAMLRIINDDVKKHDFLFAPCSKETFHLLYDMNEERHGCYEHLAQAFTPYAISPEHISTTFNIFMNVHITSKGTTKINPPLSKPDDKIIMQSQMDLIVGLTACSAPLSNNNSLKPIRYKILTKGFIDGKQETTV